MTGTEKKMVEMLIELREEYNLVGIKSEFEAEGAHLEELFRMKEILMLAGLPMTLKLGGCEAVSDMRMARIVGASRIVAPMVESPFALSKFMEAVEKTYSSQELEDLELAVNIESITGYESYGAMLDLPCFGKLDAMVIGRGDMTFSLGLGRKDMNSQKIFDITKSLFERTKARYPKIDCVVGGVPGADSLPFLERLGAGLGDEYESRKTIFSWAALEGEKAREGFLKGIAFELTWYENKREFYKNISMEDEGKIQLIRARYEAMLAEQAQTTKIQ